MLFSYITNSCIFILFNFSTSDINFLLLIIFYCMYLKADFLLTCKLSLLSIFACLQLSIILMLRVKWKTHDFLTKASNCLQHHSFKHSIPYMIAQKKNKDFIIKDRKYFGNARNELIKYFKTYYLRLKWPTNEKEERNQGERDREREENHCIKPTLQIPSMQMADPR